MVAIIVVLTIIVFIIVDMALRLVMRRMEESRITRERQEALDIGLKLDFTHEAKSLKHVEVKNPKARILAVDDEEIVLASFRKILVLAGYSVDTVETGKEALGLIQKNDYDFVFTDLKMPEMNGIEVTKGVKHLRPDIDVIVITGYATIESAVETMKYGAMDYVQKPFTEDELIDFVGKSLIRRQDRINRQIKPKVHLVTPSTSESTSQREFNVPSGVFVSPAHAWANIEMNGTIRIGLDDFVQKVIGPIDDVELPRRNQKVKKGETLFSIQQSSRTVEIPSPVSGKVISLNDELAYRPELIKLKPYELGWVCCIEPTDLANDLQSLRIGMDAVSWYQEEIDRYSDLVKQMDSKRKDGVPAGGNGKMDNETWEAFTQSFLRP